MDYFDKNFNNKTKYLQLKKNDDQIGSGKKNKAEKKIKTIDLDSNLENIFMKNDLQNNLKKIEQEYGNKFILKHNSVKLQVEITKMSHKPIDLSLRLFFKLNSTALM